MADDLEYLAAWRAGDREAGEQLSRTHYAQLLGFFRLRVGDAAEDLTQRTFLACVEGRDRVHSSSFRAYMFGVARRLLVEHIRAGDRQAAIETFAATQPQSILTPSGVVHLRQEQVLLLRALEALPLDVQLVLALHYVQGLKSREIGEVLEVPTSTVTTRLSRARDALRARVEQLRASPQVRAALVADLERWTETLAAIAQAGA
ncbi:MAG TPA: sigma-70 family RNA polymerase sigma factor, partial [Nannocystaceae bacterium]|nr:sigma-70 family RNA polymerase sigma factor [Nannocystaceae bacterium]